MFVLSRWILVLVKKIQILDFMFHHEGTQNWLAKTPELARIIMKLLKATTPT